MKAKGRKQTAYLSAELAERLEKVKDRLNISEICSRALDAAISEIEREMGEEEGRTYAMTVTSDPVAIAEVRKTEGRLRLRPDEEARLRQYPPAQREGYLAGRNAGTASIWNVLSASERPMLPLEYNPNEAK